MRIKVWHKGMSDKETADLAYWERNMLALRYAQGWYNDDIQFDVGQKLGMHDQQQLRNAGIKLTTKSPRYDGWRRVLSLENGAITFHIPDDFDVGDLPEIEPNWDRHTTEEKWQRVANYRCIDAKERL